MADRNNEKYRASLARAGRPVITAEERVRARELRSAGLTLKDIAAQLGRVTSTVHYMLKEQR
jgi:IS30 family transposase